MCRFPLKLAGFWTVQGLWAWVVLLPVTASHALAPAAAITPLAWVCAAGFVAGLGLEAVADYQKFKFKSEPGNKDKCGAAQSAGMAYDLGWQLSTIT